VYFREAYSNDLERPILLFYVIVANKQINGLYSSDNTAVIKVRGTMEMQTLVSSIVCLFEPETVKKLGFEPRELEGILHSPVSVGQTVDGKLVLTSVADQVELFLSRDRFDVRDLSGKNPGEKPIGNLMAKVIQMFGGTPKAFGFNYEIAFPAPSKKESGAYLADRFLSENQVTKVLGVDGVSVTLYYKREAKRCTMRLEPRWGDPTSDSVYVNVNLHEDLSQHKREEAKSVAGGELQKAFVSEYSQLLEVLKHLFKQ